jgi:uncharacterized OB-fold protein
VSERTIPAPPVNKETERFWAAAADGRLLIGRCRSCGQAHYYPRTLCPFCLGETDWEAASGDGVIYTYSVQRRGPGAPYAIGYVTLSEGPSLLTNFVECDFDALRCGEAVRLIWAQTEGAPVPVFRPVASTG